MFIPVTTQSNEQKELINFSCVDRVTGAPPNEKFPQGHAILIFSNGKSLPLMETIEEVAKRLV